MRALKDQTSIRLSGRSRAIIEQMHERLPWLSGGKREGNVSLAIGIALDEWAQTHDVQIEQG